MTEQEFVKCYYAMVEVEMYKTRHIDLMHHAIRCYAFWLADGLRDLDRKDMAEMIFGGFITPCSNRTELLALLIEEWNNWTDHTELLQNLRNHIVDYFGTEGK